jgi:thioredoxin-like negative regulator of GroEL
MDDLINYKKNEKRLMTEISTNYYPILVEVRAEWSGGSHLMDLIINKIEEEFKHQIKVVRIDLEVHKELLSPFGIENAPALLLISKGQVIEVIKETLSRKSLEQIIRNLINRNGSSIREKNSTNS